MNVVKEIQKLNALELERGLTDKGSWHSQYKDSAYIYIGGFPYQLTEGDMICVFSQFGEVVDVDLVRDKETGKSKGFAFLAYEDQRSTVLAVDNLNGIQISGRTIRVDHTAKYRGPKRDDDFDEEAEYKRKQAILPPHLQDFDPDAQMSDSESSIAGSGDREGQMDADALDPMRQYFADKKAKKNKKAKTEGKVKKDKKDKKEKKDKKDKKGGRSHTRD
ncbi:hypothetical protein BASA61_010272 [Batrachochytrium salamandrivorans]|nr:hypothetical protein BASA61_010272 [Batrachochytrium salamandrivorans]KAH9271276.1 hypothetical protein BASA83_006599 [Batrachochytrium salamandrivorans]